MRRISRTNPEPFHLHNVSSFNPAISSSFFSFQIVWKVLGIVPVLFERIRYFAFCDVALHSAFQRLANLLPGFRTWAFRCPFVVCVFHNLFVFL